MKKYIDISFRIYLVLIGLFVNTVVCDALATNDKDSLNFTLDEVVVGAKNQKFIEDGIEYLPIKRVKNASYDAISLLQNMHIPEVNISPVDSSIKTINGDEFAIFINNIQATSDDVLGLNPQDVKCIQVLNSPSDPRFYGHRYVVNFVMKVYEWGGYTKFNVNGGGLNGYSINGKAYEKFVVDNWTIDGVVSSYVRCDEQPLTESLDTFSDIMSEGFHFKQISRTSANLAHKNRSNNENVTLRGAYNRDGTYISHSLTFDRFASPNNNSTSLLNYSDSFLKSEVADLSLSSQTITLNASGLYQFNLRNDNFIMATWSFAHSGNRRNSLYDIDNISPIVNSSKEKSYMPALSVYYSKGLGYSNRVSINLFSILMDFMTGYEGSFNERQNLLTSESQLSVEYSHNIKDLFSLYLRAGASYVRSVLNKNSMMNYFGPRFGLELTYAVNRFNRLSIEGWWDNSIPTSSTANNALVKVDELMWIEGNPNMKNSSGPGIKLNYSFNSGNIFNFASSFSYVRRANTSMYLYYLNNNLNGVVRTFSDDYNHQTMIGSIVGSVRLFNNSLVLSARGNFKRTFITGVKSFQVNDFTAMASVSFFIKKFSFLAYYMTPEKVLNEDTGFLNRFRCTTGLTVAFGCNNFNATLSLKNCFNSGKVYFSYDSPYYSTSGSRWVNGRSRNLSLTLTYTIPYGKHVDRRDEVSNSVEKRSAILQ